MDWVAILSMETTAVMNHPRFEDALTYRLAYKLAGPEMSTTARRAAFAEATTAALGLSDLSRSGLEATST